MTAWRGGNIPGRENSDEGPDDIGDEERYEGTKAANTAANSQRCGSEQRPLRAPACSAIPPRACASQARALQAVGCGRSDCRPAAAGYKHATRASVADTPRAGLGGGARRERHRAGHLVDIPSDVVKLVKPRRAAGRHSAARQGRGWARPPPRSLRSTTSRPHDDWGVNFLRKKNCVL